MPAFQFYDPAPVFRNIVTDEPLNGGSLTFYQRGTTTPKNTWSDPELTILNTNPVVLDSDGRPNVGIFGDGEYSVKCMDAAGATQWTRVIIPGGDTTLTLPALLADQFWTSDGSNILATYIIQVPDPTGEIDKVLKSDGTVAYWGTLPATPTIESTSTKVQIGDTLWQFGSDSAPASGTHTTTKAITWTEAYTTPPRVFIQVTVANVTANGFTPAHAVLSKTTTGCTVHFDIDEGSLVAGNNISTAVTFDWQAVGRLA